MYCILCTCIENGQDVKVHRLYMIKVKWVANYSFRERLTESNDLVE